MGLRLIKKYSSREITGNVLHTECNDWASSVACAYRLILMFLPPSGFPQEVDLCEDPLLETEPLSSIPVTPPPLRLDSTQLSYTSALWRPHCATGAKMDTLCALLPLLLLWAAMANAGKTQLTDSMKQDCPLSSGVGCPCQAYQGRCHFDDFSCIC